MENWSNGEKIAARISTLQLSTPPSLLLLLVFFASVLISFGQRGTDLRPPPLDPAQAESEARALVADLLGQKPAQNQTNTGVLKIRNADGKHQQEIPVRFSILVTATNWVSVYQTTAPSNGLARMTLKVIHSDGRPNQYLVSDPKVGQASRLPNEGASPSSQSPAEFAQPARPAAAGPAFKELKGDETMVPFAGSDFWLADLGLEFFHWPKQRLLKKELRKSQSCDVLESVNPQPGANGYTRVVSWIAIEPPHGIIHADAYDAHNQLLKQFDPKKLEKVRGEYQLESMEIRNLQTGSRTRIEFDLE